MPSSHLLVLVRARTGMRAGPKKARPCPALTWPAAVPRACGPGAAVLYNYNCIHNFIALRASAAVPSPIVKSQHRAATGAFDIIFAPKNF